MEGFFIWGLKTATVLWFASALYGVGHLRGTRKADKRQSMDRGENVAPRPDLEV